jgi:GNAT superfamily N-acetyltransferase
MHSTRGRGSVREKWTARHAGRAPVTGLLRWRSVITYRQSRRAVTLIRLTELPPAFENLAVASEREGFEFVRRLEAEWRSGQNRFDRPGELLLGSLRGDELEAIGGINQDPYLADSDVGRLRHVYVRPEHRNAGVGSALVRAILDASRGRFARIRLRTANAQSHAFYERLGFQRLTSDPTATHAYPH